MELVLAADVSASIDFGEIDLQRAGYLAALGDPRVIEAMLSGPLGRIAVAYVEWADRARTSIGWTLIDSPASARAFAGAIRDLPSPAGRLTSIVNALDHSAGLFGTGGFESGRRVIDISADGRDSLGIEAEVAAARDRALARDITINGLVINPQQEQTEVEGVRYDLDGYFKAVVIGGPGAFTVVAREPAAFPEALRRKLVLEIAGR